MITRYDFFFDNQQRRFSEQLVRFFSGFQYETGRRNGNDPIRKIVPCKFVTSNNRMVETIRRNNSENTLLTVPMITVHQTGLQPRRQDVQHPGHMDTRQAVERAYDPETRSYTGEKGNSYSVQRMMPRPFDMLIQVDIWTSNQLQKDQLLEQILTVIYPAFDIQNSDNPLDWSSLTTVFVEEVNAYSISIPVGQDDAIDVATINLRLPMWLNPPAKVTQQHVIQQIVTNLKQGTTQEDALGGATIARTVTTPGNHMLKVENGTLTLLGEKANDLDGDDMPYSWASLVGQYGVLTPGETQIRLRPDIDDPSRDIIGTVHPVPGQDNLLDWQIDIDTLPRNTIAPIEGVVDPLRSAPSAGLPEATSGQRYLLINDIAAETVGWNQIVGGARVGDVIEFDGSVWRVAFESAGNSSTQYITNLNTGRQLRWTREGWVMALDGIYAPGAWRIFT